MNKIDNIMMQTAINFATLSSAKRAKVGAVLAHNGRIIACGYNGTLPGTDNICEVEIECDDCNQGIRAYNLVCDNCNGTGKTLKTSDFVLHAEQNVLTFCNRNGLITKNTTMYITMAPCKNCAKLLASAGITKVFYNETYRDMDGINFLKQLNIETKQIEGI